jgi:polyisoprenoid-binding protein YceI
VTGLNKKLNTKLNFMKHLKSASLFLASTALLILTYFVGCRHEDSVEPYKPADIVRGTAVVDLTAGWTFDKSHSNVTWETAYDGVGAMLTGRFNTFGMTKFKFDEANAANTSFEGYVWLNKVNTGEPGRDTGCLLTTFAVSKTMGDTLPNVARIKSKTITPSTTDKGFIVTCDLTFHGVTKEVLAKLSYTELTHFEPGQMGTKALDVMGFTLTWQFSAKTDYLITSSSIADKIEMTANAQFKKTYN